MSKKNNNEKKRNTYSIESQTYSPFANLLRDNNKKKGNDNMKYNNNNYNNYNDNGYDSGSYNGGYNGGYNNGGYNNGDVPGKGAATAAQVSRLPSAPHRKRRPRALPHFRIWSSARRSRLSIMRFSRKKTSMYSS